MRPRRAIPFHDALITMTMARNLDGFSLSLTDVFRRLVDNLACRLILYVTDGADVSV